MEKQGLGAALRLTGWSVPGLALQSDWPQLSDSVLILRGAGIGQLRTGPLPTPQQLTQASKDPRPRFPSPLLKSAVYTLQNRLHT